MKVNQNFIVLDVESGGFNPEQNLLTQIGFIVLDGFTMQEKYR
jgi:DNA polymerase III epsilon subunit-like protein